MPDDTPTTPNAPEPGRELYQEALDGLEAQIRATVETAAAAELLERNAIDAAKTARNELARLRARRNALLADMKAGAHTFDTSDDRPRE